MKNKKIFIFIVIWMFLLITSCTTHTHQYSDKWNFDENNHYHECSCGDKSDIALHSWDEGEVVKEATSTSEGLMKYQCTICNATKEVSINKLDHVHDLINHEGKASTCTVQGYKPYDTCKNCDYTTYKALPLADHDLINHEGKASTCTEAGFKPYDTCKNCDYTTYEALKKLDHQYSTTYKYDETKHYYECSCGEKSGVQNHTWNEGEVVKQPNLISTGLKVYKCIVCDATKNEILDKIVSNELVICGYNTLNAVGDYVKYEGIRLYDKNTSLDTSLYWHKIALKIEKGNYVVSEVASSGNSLTKEYDYLILAYNHDALVKANFEVGNIVIFSSDISALTSGLVNITINKATGDETFEINYCLGYEHFNTKDDLYEAYFTDYYNFLVTMTDCNMEELNITNLQDFLSICKTWDAYEKNEMAGLGNAFGRYYLVPTLGGSFADQPTTHFIGYCYQNNKYLDLLEFLEVFFAYWRTDEGYTTETNHGNDFFYSSWAAFVDTCKFFYFTSDTITEKYKWFTEARSPRVHWALDNVPGVGAIELETTGKLSNPIVLPELKRMYYTFVGWFDESGNEVKIVASSMTVFAKFIRNTYEVTFKNGSEEVLTERVKEGLRINTIPSVENETYEFVNWVLPDFSTYDYLNGVTQNLSFFATWQSTTGTIGTININGYNTQDATTGFEQYMGLMLFKKGVTLGSSLYWHKIAVKYLNGEYVISDIITSGNSLASDYDYLLVSYSNETSGKYQQLLDLNLKIGDKVVFSKNLSDLSNGSINVDVTFSRANQQIYNLILVDNGADLISYSPYIEENSTINLPTIVKSGYIFKGWYYDSNFSGDAITTLIEVNSNITLYAKWEEKQIDDVLSFISDVVTSNTIDELPNTFKDATLTWITEDDKLYTIKDGKGFTNRLYQTHQIQSVDVKVIIDDGITTITKSKRITINPVLFDDINNPKATYFSVSSTSNYLNNNTRYLNEGTLFSDKFKKNMNMIYYAFAIPQADGTLTLDTRYLDEVKQLKNSGIRVLLVIDGANKTPLQAMVNLCNDDVTRATFVNNIINMITKYNLDGVDIDWEFPGTSGLSGFTTEIDQTNLNKLLRDLRNGLDNIQALNGSNYIISAAIPSTSWGAIRYDFKGNSELGGINTYCDYVNMMSYDLNKSTHTSHVASCYSSQNSNDYKFGAVYGTEKFVSLGLDKNKIIIGAAAYGKTYSITGTVNSNATYPALGVTGTLTKISGITGSYASGTIYYSAIASLEKSDKYVKYTEYKNGKVVGSYLYNATDNLFITYDSKEAIIEKCNYASSNGLGIMVWAYGEDATDTIIDTICDNL